jgi:PhzF family phenazine biosynthesis protein
LKRRIRHVDAFTRVPLEGNPAAVVDGEGIDDTTMQRIALNQRLSETVFLLPADSRDNHVRARIFTPAAELPFAGHPIVATAHVVISEGIATLNEGEPLLIETGAGVIPVVVSTETPPRYTMTQSTPRFAESQYRLGVIASWLGLAQVDLVRSEYVDTGIRWLIAQVATLEAFTRIDPQGMFRADEPISVFCIGAADPEASVHVRTFAPQFGIVEDPVTGSSNGCIGALIAKHALLPAKEGAITYVAEQGVEMGQPGRIYVSVSGPPDALVVQVGGYAVTVLEGELSLPG